jgi:PucR C-terminal helix-turn-helix domain
MIARRMALRRSAIVAEAARELRDCFPAYRRLQSPTLRTDLPRTLDHVVSTYLGALCGGRLLSPEEEAHLGAIGARRAEQGVPRATLAAAAQVVAAVGWRHLGEVAATLPPTSELVAALVEMGAHLGRFSARVVEVMSAAYDAGDDGGPGGRSRFVAEVLDGDAGVDAPMLARAARWGLDGGAWHGLLLVRAAPSSEGATQRHAVAATLAHLPEAFEVPLSAAGTSHGTLVVRADRDAWDGVRAIARTVAKDHRVTILGAPPVAGMVALRAAYARACCLLRLAGNAGQPARFVEPRDLRVLGLLVDGLDDRESFLDETIGPILRLPEAPRSTLLKTLRAVRDAPLKGGVRTAADALNVHVKTVYYRLERIRELTGLDPGVSTDRVHLALALELLSLADVV